MKTKSNNKIYFEIDVPDGIFVVFRRILVELSFVDFVDLREKIDEIVEVRKLSFDLVRLLSWRHNLLAITRNEQS